MTTKDKKQSFRFVDPHVHFYDMKHPTLHYAHWQPDQDHPTLGAQTRKLGEKNYLAQDFLKESQPHQTEKCVHVQAAIGSKDPVEETKWLQEAQKQTGAPNAIVGYVDLRHKNAQQVIEQHLHYSAFKGIRDFSYGDYLASDDFQRGFALLGRYNLISSMPAEWQDMEKLIILAKKNPETVIVLNHTGLPSERTRDYFLQWRKGMTIATEAENIYCQISGLGMADNNWTIDSIMPYVETAIELFGTNRSFFATNWPIDSLWSDYGTVVNTYRKITTSYTEAEKEALFALNAETIYKI